MDVEFYLNKAERAGVSRFYREYLKVLLSSGCRVSSLFELYGSRITQEGNLIIYQKKGSRPIFYDTGTSREWWQALKRSGNADIARCNRQFFYRLCDRLGIGFRMPGNVRNYVTHAARAERAKEVWNATGDIESVAAALGHKSTRSSRYYIEGQRTNRIRQRGVLKNPYGVLDHLIITKTGKMYWK